MNEMNMHLTNRNGRVIHVYNGKSVTKVYYNRPGVYLSENINGKLNVDTRRERENRTELNNTGMKSKMFSSFPTRSPSGS